MSFDDDPLLKSEGRIREEVDEELDHHLSMVILELQSMGWSATAARDEAERRLGNRSKHRSACERIQRERRISEARRDWRSGVGLDLRHAARSLRRAPGYSAVAVITLILCIGAATLTFSLVDGVLLRSLAFHDPEQLVAVWQLQRDDGDHEFVSPANFIDWHQRSRSFADLAAVEDNRTTLTDLGEPVRIEFARVSGEFFAVYGEEPHLGRWLVADDIENKEPVAVIGHTFWQSYFAGDPAAVGHTINLGGIRHTVVGVMPQGFAEPRGVQVWTPLVFDFDIAGSRGAQYLRVIGRLGQDTGFAQAVAELDVVARALEVEYPDNNRDRGIALVPLHEALVGDSRRPLLILFGAVGLVLVLGIANVTGLGLAHGQARRSELALRSAIGAGAARILRQVTIENLILTVIGGAGGAVLAFAGLEILKRALPYPLPRVESVTIDARVLAFALLVAVLTALTMAGWRTVEGRRSSLIGPLRGLVTGTRAGRGRFGLVAAEVAVAVVLLSGAGLLIRSFSAILAVDPGFQADGVLVFRLGLSESEHPRETWASFYDRLQERLEAVPGVRTVGLNPWIPFDSGWFFSYQVIGAPVSDPSKRPSAAMRFINDSYFESLAIPLAAGRTFTANDREGSLEVAIVNETFAKRAFAGGSPLGAAITVGYGRGEPVARTIVGVVGDIDQFALGSGSAPTIYVPHRQLPFAVMTVALRTDGDPSALGAPAREVVRQLDPRLAIEGLQTMDQRIHGSLGERRFLTVLLSLFTMVALLIAAIGIYALLAQQVTIRRQELGVRLAMGAQGHDLVAFVLWRVVLLATSGIVLGVAMALGAGRVLEQQLFGVGPHDPATLALAALGLLGLGLLAGAIPAWRATRVDPNRVLRSS